MADSLQRFSECMAQFAAQCDKLRKKRASIAKKARVQQKETEDGVAQFTAQCDALRKKAASTAEAARVQQTEVEDEISAIEAQATALARSYCATGSAQTPPTTAKRLLSPALSKHTPITGFQEQQAKSAESITTPAHVHTRYDSPLTGAPDENSGDSDDENIVSSQSALSAATAYPIIHENYPTVVLLEAGWTEIWCGDCGANFKAHHRKFLPGLRGLHGHWIKAHGDQHVDHSRLAFLATCRKRLVSPMDVELMRRGEEPDVVILARRSLFVSAKLPRTTNESSSRKPTVNHSGASGDGARRLQPSSGQQGLTSRAAVTDSERVAPGKELTEYEAYQNIVAHAGAEGNRPTKRRRTTGRES
ncbi:hypothetical protein LTR86_008473 [Recurvomyces mirabilis]|nr:hypothetical protein LTR86_008473 [Recurvomyces mirabilis]